jgi:hypothetical protein
LFSVVPEVAILCEPDRPAARRRSKNSGGGIAPAAIAVLIEAGSCSVNAFRVLAGRRDLPERGGKMLKWLNFPGAPGIGWQRLRAQQIIGDE